MGRAQKDKAIDGHKWTVNQLPARQANRYKARILKMIGPAIGDIMPVLGGLDVDGDDAVAALALLQPVMATLAKHIDPDILTDTMVDLMEGSVREDDKGIAETMTPELFDDVFAGNDSELYQALWFIIQVNYPDFIGWVGSRLTGLHPKDSQAETPEKPQPAPMTSK